MDHTEVREQVAVAVWCLRSMSAKGCFPAQIRSGLPDPIRDWWEQYGKDEIKTTRVKPSKDDYDTMDRVIPWFFAIGDTKARAALFLHSIPLSWRKVGMIMGVSHETARKLEAQAVGVIAARFDKIAVN